MLASGVKTLTRASLLAIESFLADRSVFVETLEASFGNTFAWPHPGSAQACLAATKDSIARAPFAPPESPPLRLGVSCVGLSIFLGPFFDLSIACHQSMHE